MQDFEGLPDFAQAFALPLPRYTGAPELTNNLQIKVRCIQCRQVTKIIRPNDLNSQIKTIRCLPCFI